MPLDLRRAAERLIDAGQSDNEIKAIVDNIRKEASRMMDEGMSDAQIESFLKQSTAQFDQGKSFRLFEDAPDQKIVPPVPPLPPKELVPQPRQRPKTGGTGEFIGGTAGSLIGTAVPVPGARIVGAGIGAGLGRAGEQIIRGETPDPADILQTGLTAAGSEAVAPKLFGLLSKAARPFVSKIRPGTKEASKLLATKGASLTAGQATESRVLDIAENVAESSLIGGGRMRAFKLNQKEAINAIADDFAQQFGRAGDPIALGEITFDTINKGDKAFRATARTMFGGVDQLAQKFQPGRAPQTITSPIVGPSGQAITRQIPGRPATGGVSLVAAKDFANEMLDQQLITSKEGVRLLKEIQRAPDAVDFKTAQVLRSDLLAVSRPLGELTGDKAVQQAKHLSSLVDNAMEQAGQRLDPVAFAKFREANEFFKAGKEVFNNKLLRSLMTTVQNQPEALVPRLLTPRGVSLLKRVREATNEPTFKNIQSSLMEGILDKAKDVEGQLIGKGFKRQLDTLGNAYLKEAFGDETARRLKTFADTAIRTQAVSPTGIGNVAIQLTQVGALTSLAIRGVEAGAATVIVGPTGLSRILTSPTGIKFLTEGIQLGRGTEEATRFTTRFLGWLAKEGINVESSLSQQSQ